MISHRLLLTNSVQVIAFLDISFPSWSCSGLVAHPLRPQHSVKLLMKINTSIALYKLTSTMVWEPRRCGHAPVVSHSPRLIAGNEKNGQWPRLRECLRPMTTLIFFFTKLKKKMHKANTYNLGRTLLLISLFSNCTYWEFASVFFLYIHGSLRCTREIAEVSIGLKNK